LYLNAENAELAITVTSIQQGNLQPTAQLCGNICVMHSIASGYLSRAASKN